MHMDKDTEQFDAIKFKPMSEGLGLNHFADGLPYTPASTRRRQAVQFNFPPPRAPRTPTTPPQPQESAPVLHEELKEVTTIENAGFVRRILAFGLDLLFAVSMFAVIVWASFSLNGFDFADLIVSRRGVQMFWPLTLLYMVVHMGYFLIQETTWRRTLGKALMGIRIQTSSGFATLGRAACFFVSAIPFGIGLLWYFFDSKRRCWHDVITDSEVVTG
jgi:uncharacterized RDD family membrane protein YckC